MSAELFQRATEIFAAARRLAPEERGDFLDEACAGDAALRTEVESLLAQDAKADSGGALASGGALELFETRRVEEDRAGTDAPERIGPYRILSRLGEGGMGEVYLAEQEAPLRRQVALKLIKLGMDTREVIRRFDSERQALALMDHSSIAKVHDAGTTEAGRPYFAMEYVEGTADHPLLRRETN